MNKDKEIGKRRCLFITLLITFAVLYFYCPLYAQEKVANKNIQAPGQVLTGQINRPAGTTSGEITQPSSNSLNTRTFTIRQGSVGVNKGVKTGAITMPSPQDQVRPVFKIKQGIAGHSQIKRLKR